MDSARDQALAALNDGQYNAAQLLGGVAPHLLMVGDRPDESDDAMPPDVGRLGAQAMALEPGAQRGRGCGGVASGALR